MYSPATLVCIRAAIHRHLTSAEVNKKINILKDDDFKRSNVMLKSMVGKFLKEGNGSCQSYPAIEQSDLIKMRQFFDRSNGAVLQMEVWFNLLYYFALRSRETIRYLTLESFSVSCDYNNKKYVSIKHDFISKNTKSSLIRKEYENIKQCRMYDNPSVHCPVEAFELYMDKLKKVAVSLCFPCQQKMTKTLVLQKMVLQKLCPRKEHFGRYDEKDIHRGQTFKSLYESLNKGDISDCLKRRRNDQQ